MLINPTSNESSKANIEAKKANIETSISNKTLSHIVVLTKNLTLKEFLVEAMLK